MNENENTVFNQYSIFFVLKLKVQSTLLKFVNNDCKKTRQRTMMRNKSDGDAPACRQKMLVS